MAIVILVLALVAYAYALIVEPGFRRWGLLGGAAVGLGMAVYFWLNSPESDRTGTRIAADEITLDQLDFETTPRGAILTGRVLNASPDWRLREMTLEVTLRDCPAIDADADAGDCPVIGEASAIARPDTPPGQLRGFTTRFVFPNLPPVSGVLRWDWRITGTRATQ
jgi:hypothetical protein